jgi:hypothetical protein
MTTPKLGPKHFEALEFVRLHNAQPDGIWQVIDEIPAILRASDERIKELEREAQSWETKVDFWRDRAKEFKPDAERYRFLRTNTHNNVDIIFYATNEDSMAGIGIEYNDQSFDDAVDSIMKPPQLYTSSPDHGEDL